eukprot:CAMPEP_0115016396 /NCGR_PEP_ID=MMETSP0216-20121206/27413_1 /TAXON_ID=223996 /ORGANISM="Protocruzia adherens, Strain Boccale" /LENGTH=436 /DNA_ID=CAMNT_0002386847 /DNA_START=32 /DNA_END=1342 /DNA_ORIENTATION=+
MGHRSKTPSIVIDCLRKTPLKFPSFQFASLTGLEFNDSPFLHQTHFSKIKFPSSEERSKTLDSISDVFASYNIPIFKKDRNDSEWELTFQGKLDDSEVQKTLSALTSTPENVEVQSSIEVPWFPSEKSDLNHIGKRVMSANAEIGPEHPGYKDKEYRKRREIIAQIAEDYEVGQDLPIIDYTEEEHGCWNYIRSHLDPFYREFACQEYLEGVEKLNKNCGFSKGKIPQLRDISEYLKQQTGWSLKPAAGFLTNREFLNGLAFKVFHCTQYMRHFSRPLFTPDPDISHEVIGHCPMFTNRDFCDMSQTIGLASLGASDDDIARLGTLYWFTVEFGLVEDEKTGAKKGYGAGVLGSAEEMENAISGNVKYVPLDCAQAAEMEFPIDSVQSVYTVAHSFQSARDQLREFSLSLEKPFNAEYDEVLKKIVVNIPSSTHKN